MLSAILRPRTWRRYVLRNFCKLSPDYTASHTGTLHSHICESLKSNYNRKFSEDSFSNCRSAVHPVSDKTPLIRESIDVPPSVVTNETFTSCISEKNRKPPATFVMSLQSACDETQSVRGAWHGHSVHTDSGAHPSLLSNGYRWLLGHAVA
jgi:hypothetical protein